MTSSTAAASPASDRSALIFGLSIAILGAVLFVARDGPRATAFAEALAFFAPELPVMQLPSWDCLPYDRVGPSPAVAAARTATLTALARRDPKDSSPLVLVTTVPAVLQRVPPREALKAAAFSARSGGRPIAHPNPVRNENETHTDRARFRGRG